MATTLAVGDVALVGYSADTGGKSLAFVLLTDVEAGTVINITDNGWLAAGGFRPGEGVVTYTAPPGGARAGTVITFTGLTGALNPSTGGDQFIVYQQNGSAITPLFALDFADGNTTYAGDATNSNTSAVPTGLVFGDTALAFAADNGAYTGPLSGTRSELLAAIATEANWSENDATPQPYAAAFTVRADAGPSVAVADVTVVEGDAGTTAAVFTLTRTGSTTSAFTVDFATANGTATAGSDYQAANGTVSFAAGQTTATVAVTINGDTAFEPSETFLLNLSNATGGTIIADGQATGTITNDDAAPTARAVFIHDVQGTAFFSPILAAEGIAAFNTVSMSRVTVQAVVTALDGAGARQGFFLMEEAAQWDTDFRTSEGIFVMTRDDANVGVALNDPAFAGLTVGEVVTVTAFVVEYSSFGNPPRTFLTNPTIVDQSNTSVALPTYVLDGSEGRRIPNSILSDDNPDYTDSSDGAGDTFDPLSDALDFFETIEGMRVTVPDMVVADGQVDGSAAAVRFKAYSTVHADGDQINSRGGYTIAGDPLRSGPDTLDLDDAVIRGGRHLHDGDVNPDVLELDFGIPGRGGTAGFAEAFSMGDRLGAVTGVIDFDFQQIKLFVTDPVDTTRLDGSPSVETTTLRASARELAVATFNVENLDPGDDTTVDEGAAGGVGRFNDIARAIAGNLGAPDVISLEEIQDNNGQAAGGVDASITLQRLADAVSAETGMRYQWVDELPINNAEGGAPNGNIRVAFLYNTTRVQLGDLAPDATIAERRQFTDRIGDGQRDAGDRIAFSDDQLGAEINTADWTNTRRSLLGEFRFNGNTVYVSANHWPSKGGSGEFYQADQNIDAGQPANRDWDQRNAIAQDVWSMMNLISGGAPQSRQVAAGDFNEFYFYRPMEVLTGSVGVDGSARTGGARFTNLTVSELTAAERYTFVFAGRSQAIDHIVVDQALAGVADYDIVHLNTGFSTRAGGVNPALSDHDPVLARFDFRSFAERLVGGTGADRIDGEGGDDVLSGGGGDDDLLGGAGQDLIGGGDGNDTISGGDGDDFIGGETGNDRISGGAGVDVLFGDAGNDLIGGGTGNDRLFGQDGDDFMGGEDGNDFLDGGAGVDVLFGDAGDDAIIGGVGSDRLFGQDGNDRLDGQGDDDFVDGGAGDDTLSGGGGNDRLLGGAGADLIGGGAGDDSIEGSDGDDFVGGEDGGDRISGGAGVDVLFGDAGADLIGGGTGADRLFGQDGDDFIGGEADNDFLDGGAGIDVLFGDAGDDAILGGVGNDRLFGQQGNDTLVGQAGDDFLDGGAGADIAVFGGARSGYTIATANGTTTVTGSDGVDTLIGIETLQFGDQAVVLSSVFADQDGLVRARLPDFSEQSLSSLDLLVL